MRFFLSGLTRELLGNVLLAIGEWLNGLAFQLLGIDDEVVDPETFDLLEARARLDIQQDLDRQEHPCWFCKGECFVRVPDGWEPCHDCDAQGIDPVYKASLR